MSQKLKITSVGTPEGDVKLMYWDAAVRINFSSSPSSQMTSLECTAEIDCGDRGIESRCTNCIRNSHLKDSCLLCMCLNWSISPFIFCKRMTNLPAPEQSH